MARSGEEQDMAEKTKNLGAEKNMQREQTEKTKEEDNLDTGKSIKTWKERKMKEKKDGTGRRLRSKKPGGGSSREDCMEVGENTNDYRTYKTPVQDRTDQGKSEREEDEGTEEEVILLPKTSLRAKTPQEKSASKASAKKASYLSVVKKGIAEQDGWEAPTTTTVVMTFNIQIGKGGALLKQFKN